MCGTIPYVRLASIISSGELDVVFECDKGFIFEEKYFTKSITCILQTSVWTHIEDSCLGIVLTKLLPEKKQWVKNSAHHCSSRVHAYLISNFRCSMQWATHWTHPGRYIRTRIWNCCGSYMWSWLSISWPVHAKKCHVHVRWPLGFRVAIMWTYE